MPELPEVETLKRSLALGLPGRIIIRVQMQRANLRYPLVESLQENVLGAKIIDLTRRAKYLIINLDNGNSLVVHLGMSGRFTRQKPDYQLKKHDHLIFYLDDESKLVFNDARRFGMIYCFPSSSLMEESIFKNLGPEPLGQDFSASYLQEKLCTRRTPIKTALMNNDIVVGVGNIYASESLFLAKIHPQRLANSLSDKELSNLVKAVIQVLENAITAGGTTLKDFVSGDNKPGYFSQKLLVYGRTGDSCYTCSGIIVKLRQAGRASFYCEDCQGV